MKHPSKPLGRRYECMHYPSCLTEAAKRNAPAVPCTGCARYDPIALGPEGINGEFFNMAKLWLKILAEDE